MKYFASFVLSVLMLMSAISFGSAVYPKQTIISQPFHNTGVVEIDHPEAYSRVVAISDVHGMYYNLVKLLRAVHLVDVVNGNVQWIGGNSLLIVVGDSIDKGPDSLNVIDLWMELTLKARSRGGEILHLLGNHEAEFLADPTNAKSVVLRKELQRKGVSVQQLISPNFPRGAYLRSMPLAARVGNWLFCHAGLYPTMIWPMFKLQASRILSLGLYGHPLILGDDSILEAKDWWRDPRKRANLEGLLTTNHFYGVVFGHQPDALNVRDEIASIDQMRIIKIDSGMAPPKEGLKDGGYPGHLLVFIDPADMNKMGPPQAYSMSALGTMRPLVR